MGEAANLTKLLGAGLVIKIGQCMGPFRTRGQADFLEQGLSHEMGDSVPRLVYADIDTGFAVIKWLKLCMGIGHVQQVHITPPGQIISQLCLRSWSNTGQRQSSGSTQRQQF